jgi:hypothetical protein
VTSSALVVPNIATGALPPGPPAISITGITAYGGLGANNSQLLQDSYQAYDDISLTKGVHSLTFGFAFEKIADAIQAQGEGSLGSFTFISHNATVGSQNAISALENFLSDVPQSVNAASPNFQTYPVQSRSSVIGGYAQDTWRARSNFTINAGLRYEMLTNPTDAGNRLSTLNAYPAPAAVGGCPNTIPGAPFVATTVLGCPVPITHLWNSNPTLRNFSPRVGIAWDPFKDGKTSVRAGFGIFDVLPLPYTYTANYDTAYPFFVSYQVPGSGVPPPGSFPNIAPFVSPGVAAMRYVEPNPKRSYVMNWNFNIQRQLTSKLTLTLAYVGSHSLHLDHIADAANYALPTLINGVWTWPSAPGPVADPNASTIRQLFWSGYASYSSFQSQLQFKTYHGFSGQAAFTLGRCISNGDSSGFADPFANSVATLFPWDNAMARGPCDFDLHDNFVGNFFYTPPSPKNGAAKWVAGGWQLGGIISASSGTPFSLLTGGDPLNMVKSPEDFPNAVAGCNPYQANFKSLAQPRYLNPACFVVAPVTPNGPVFGNLGRNNLYGPGLLNVDFSVLKNIPVRERVNLQMRFEFFNLFNHTNFQGPFTNNTLGGSLGLINATVTPSREIQLGAKIIW